MKHWVIICYAILLVQTLLSFYLDSWCLLLIFFFQRMSSWEMLLASHGHFYSCKYFYVVIYLLKTLTVLSSLAMREGDRWWLCSLSSKFLLYRWLLSITCYDFKSLIVTSTWKVLLAFNWLSVVIIFIFSCTSFCLRFCQSTFGFSACFKITTTYHSYCLLSSAFMYELPLPYEPWRTLVSMPSNLISSFCLVGAKLSSTCVYRLGCVVVGVDLRKLAKVASFQLQLLIMSIFSIERAPLKLTTLPANGLLGGRAGGRGQWELAELLDWSHA